ncbi:YihY/virulence factor BrkB family protein [Shimazuella alba]|uniref:YihY family inner membrane protein n=1 Tax=Shimazuella alba TaxID=2690964 RepID=A0A6I4W004_9BACL|nr:YihY/virulence factor BrkB family protein [Shimazuella alba]MXQ55550.1 YihY family inner membrane protein [Shimazuella alba]
MAHLLKTIIYRLRQNNVFDIAAQLSYYILLSFFPFLLLAVTLIGYLPYSSENVLSVIKPVIPSDTYHLIENNLVSILDEQNSGILSLSIISTVYLASLAFQSIIRSLDVAYQVKNNRSFWKGALLGFLTMFGLLAGLLVTLALSVFGQVWASYFLGKIAVATWFLHLWIYVRWFISSGLVFIVLLCLYKFAPYTKVTFVEALPGAIFATLGWQLSSYAFSFYASSRDYSLVYGSLGGIIILTGWFYVSALVLVIGGQINAAYAEEKKSE